MILKKIMPSDIWYFILATLFLYFCQILILVFPFRHYIKIFSSPENAKHDRVTYARVLMVRKALLRGLHYLPWNGKCLVQALAGRLLLRVFNLPGTIYLGVDKADGKLKAHAWLKSGNQFVSGQESHRKFTIVQQIS